MESSDKTVANTNGTSILTLYTRWRYLVLLATLLLLLVVQPVSSGYSTPTHWIDLLLALVTVALLMTFCQDRKKRGLALALSLPTILFTLGGHLFATQIQTTILLAGHCMAAIFCFWAAVLIVGSLLRSQEVTYDSIFGAICGYLLLGMAWGLLYVMLDAGWPDSFSVATRLAQEVSQNNSRVHLFNYYSFVTLTTVGYGDVTPLSTPARTCAWIEAMTGQFYLAILVAGLAGALLAKNRLTQSDGS